MNTVIYRRSAVHNEKWLADQETACRQYASELGLTVTGSYYDIGRTGHGLDAMLEAVQQDDVSAVIVNDLERLREKINEHLATVQRLQEAGVTIHVTKEKTTNGRDAIFVGIKQAYAEFQERHDDPLPGGHREP